MYEEDDIDDLPLVQRASEIEDEDVDWLWMHRIPAGTLSRVDGNPGLGKSVMTLDLAAKVSTGEPLPGSDEVRPPADVLVMAAEDDKATIKRRLVAAGADLDRVHIVTSEMLTLPKNNRVLERMIEERDIRLAIIDPLMAFLGEKVNANQDHDVRKVLRPLRAIAERTGAAILLVGHLNKSDNTTSIYRSVGSIGLLASVRVAMLVAEHPTEPNRRALSVSKSNLGPKPESWVFEVVDGGRGDPLVKWIETADLSADDLLKGRPTTSDKGSLAKALLVEMLTGTDVAANEILAEAARRQIGESMVRAAKKALGVNHYDLPADPGTKGHGRSMWTLDDVPQRSLTASASATNDLKKARPRRRKRPTA